MKNGHTYYPKVQTALQDAQRTLGLVRQHAAEWHVDPHKVGVIGFSAGGHLVAAVSTHFAQRTYPPVDAADELSCRPDFAIALYPGHLWTPGTNLTLRPDIRVRADTPPTFLLQAEDDPVDPVKHSLTYYVELQKAGVLQKCTSMRRAAMPSACAPPSCPSVAGPGWWSSGCTPSACSALRKTE